MSFALSLLYAFLMLLLPLAEALYHQRSPGALLYLYWVESFTLLMLHPIRIWLHQRWTNATGHRYPSVLESKPNDTRRKRQTIKSDASPYTFLKSYMIPITIFTVAHGFFILLLVFVFKVAGPVSVNDVRAATIWGAGVPFTVFVIDLFNLRQWTFARLQLSVGNLGLRLLVTQLGIIFGMLATALTKSPWGLFAVFFVFRVLTDALVDWSKRKKGKLGLSNRIARWVAKKENKSIEQVHAEFQASMKTDDDFEALLNQPFDPKAKKRTG